MLDKILQLFAALPNELYVFIISMLPIVELRIAVPIGAVLGIPFYLNFIFAVLGNILPVPLILLFISRLLDIIERVKFFRPAVLWLRGKAQKQSKRVLIPENTAEKEDSIATAPDAVESETVEITMNEEFPSAAEGSSNDAPPKKRKMTRAIFIALMLFVAIPLPGTGAWTASLVSALFDLPRRKSFIAILLGVIVCGIIMTLASYGVIEFLSFLI